MEEGSAIMNSLSLKLNQVWRESGDILGQERKFHDLELRCGTHQVVKCHKLIMASLSSMFYHSLVDSQSSECESVILLPDFDFHVVKEFVNNVYEMLASCDGQEVLSISHDLSQHLGLFGLNEPVRSNEDLQVNRAGLVEIKTEPLQEEEFEEPECHVEQQFSSDSEWQSEQGKRKGLRLRAATNRKRKAPPKAKASSKAPKKIYNCDLCHKSFKYQSERKKHRNEVHLLIMISCRRCRREMKVSDFQNHFDKFHKGFVCDTCGQSCLTPPTLHAHKKRKHTPLPCPVCCLEFLGTESLAHHRSESDNCAFTCQECRKKFTTIVKLKVHKAHVHTAEKDMKYHCEHCGKGCYDRYKLREHVSAVHTRERPFVCKFNCGAAFNRHANMVDHQNRVHMKKKRRKKN